MLRLLEEFALAMARLTLVTVACLLVVSCAPVPERAVVHRVDSGACEAGFQYEFSFGTGGNMSGQFRSPSSVRFDSFGSLLVADTGNNRVQKFDRSGRFIMEFGALGSSEGGLNKPTDCVENSLFVYVVDSVNERIVQYDSEGRFVSVCLTREGLAGRASRFRPTRVGFSRSGYVFVNDLETDALLVFSRFWEPISIVGGFGAGEGRFHQPGGIAFGEDGTIFVCDTGNKRLQLLGSVGSYLREVNVCAGQAGCQPADVAVGPEGSVYVVDSGLRRVLVLWPDGRFRCEITGTPAGRFVQPLSVAVSAKGSLYVLDSGAERVDVFRAVEDPGSR